MSWLPLMLNLQGCRCLVAGGGKTALRKTYDLLASGAKVTVVAPSPDRNFNALPVHCLRRSVTVRDVRGVGLAVDATGDAAVGQMLAAACREQGIFFCSASNPEQGTAIFPAVLRRGRLTAAISTGGASPAASAWVRDRLDSLLPACMEEILDQMQELRGQAKARIPAQKARAAFLHACLDRALALGRPLTETELEPLWPAEDCP